MIKVKICSLLSGLCNDLILTWLRYFLFLNFEKGALRQRQIPTLFPAEYFNPDLWTLSCHPYWTVHFFLDMDATECEKKRVEYIDDLTDLEKQFAILREQ